MGEWIKNYFSDFLDINYYFLAIDIIVALGLLVCLFIFFYRRNNPGLFGWLVLYLAVAVVVKVLRSAFGAKVLPVIDGILPFVGVVYIVIVVTVYQNDFKSLVARITRKRAGTKPRKYNFGNNDSELIQASQDIARAVQTLSKKGIGALIIIVPTAMPEHILATGTMLNAQLSYPLLVSLFNKDCPLHDGAVVISGDKIIAAGCFLPLTQRTNIDKELGTRHRAAIGITEQSDVLTIIVSEETNIISTASKGDIKRYLTMEKLISTIQETYGISKSARELDQDNNF